MKKTTPMTPTMLLECRPTAWYLCPGQKLTPNLLYAGQFANDKSFTTRANKA